MSENLEAIVMRVDGTKETVPLPITAGDRLKELQRLVGGFIEVVPLKDGRYLVVHKDEKMRPHSRNATATALVQFDGWVAADDYIAGTAVIVEEDALQ